VTLRLDCHVHTFADGPGRGWLSEKARRSLAMRWLRLRHGGSADAIERSLVESMDDASDVLDGAVVLAFDAVYGADGRKDEARTHFVVENDHVAALAAANTRLFFGASIHPYRPDAIAALERAVGEGAVLVKWLPPTQGIDPADSRTFEFYDALAHHGLPLLSHTGAEHTLPVLDGRLGDPARLESALRRGVTVIMAHAALPLWPWERSGLPSVRTLMRRYEHCYADTAALAVPQRRRALRRLFADPVVGPRLVHGSDWPVEPFAWRQRRERNPLRRDVLIKRSLGAPDDYWTRGAGLLRLPGVPSRAATR